MSNIIPQIEAFEKALVMGDLSKLTESERLSFYKKICDSLGLNPLTKPFEYIELNRKLTLYATKSCTEQLRSIHKVSLNITARDKFNDVYVVTARARTPDGREDEATGAVSIGGLKGDALANAFMKAETKSKRRVTLSICGLGMLDESEIETIPQAKSNQEIQNKQRTSLPASNLVYRIKGGPYDGLTIKELFEKIGPKSVFEYVNELVKKAPTNAKVQELAKEVGDFAANLEPEPMPEEPPQYEPESYFQQDDASELDEALESTQDTYESHFVQPQPENRRAAPNPAPSTVSKDTSKPTKKAARADAVKQLIKACESKKVTIRQLSEYLQSIDETLTSLSEDGLMSAKKFLESSEK